jgi:hypothetical protein
LHGLVGIASDRDMTVRFDHSQCQADNTSRCAKGTWHHATRLAEALFDGQAEELVQKAISMALAGDPTVMRLALERLCPPRRDRPVSVANMPSIKAASDLITAASVLT